MGGQSDIQIGSYNPWFVIINDLTGNCNRSDRKDHWFMTQRMWAKLMTSVDYPLPTQIDKRICNSVGLVSPETSQTGVEFFQGRVSLWMKTRWPAKTQLKFSRLLVGYSPNYPHSTSIESMVWREGGGRAISFDSRTSMVAIRGTLTAHCYVDDILNTIVSFFLPRHIVLTFQVNNARSHTAIISTNYFHACLARWVEDF